VIPASWIDRARATPIEAEIERRGIRLVGELKKRLDRCGPCPHCGGHDRFSINIRKRVFRCRGCGAKGDVIALVMFLDGCDFRTAVETLTGERADDWEPPQFSKPASSPPADCSDADCVKAAIARWNKAVGPRGTIVETYLAGRGLKLTDDIAGDVIRFDPRHPWKDDDDSLIHVPAMLAAMRDIRTDELVAISRRRLTPEGQKVGKPRFRGLALNAAIKLDADEHVTNGLHICEGVETGIAGRMFNLKPMWALGSKDAIANFPVLGGIDCLTILVEPDAEAEVEKCARRWWDAGREVILNRSNIGKDLADACAATRKTTKCN